MNDMIDYYKAGRKGYYAWMTSLQYAQFERSIPAKDAIKLFLPPPPQDLMQVSRPLPPDHQEWLRGFEEAQANGE